MEPLSPRSTNIKVKKSNSKKNLLEAQAAATRQRKNEKQDGADQLAAAADAEKRRARGDGKDLKRQAHPDPPPRLVSEPKGARGDRNYSYKTGKYLGKGGFAICYEGQIETTAPGSAKIFALKVVKTAMPQQKMAEKFKTELQIHSKMRHPSIVEFHRAFSFGTSTYIVLELCTNGSMMDMVKQRRQLTEEEIRRFTIQTCGAIKYMHSKGVVHRDLKMGNIFLDDNMNVKVGDFGLAALLVSDKEFRRMTLCGTPNYIAPEILERGRKGHDNKVDIWSLGVIIFAQLTGRPPFQSSTQQEIYRKVQNRDFEWPTEQNLANPISAQARDLVDKVLVVNAEHRPDPDEIVCHPFFKDGFVPFYIPREAREKKPLWEDHSARYKSSWARVCAESGVGIHDGSKVHGLALAKGKRFPPVGEDIGVSVYKQCGKEAALGLAPTVPLPLDSVYLPFRGETQPASVAPDSIPQRNASAIGAQARMPGAFPAPSSPDSAPPAALVPRQEPIGVAAPNLPRSKKSHAATLRERAAPNTKALPGAKGWMGGDPVRPQRGAAATAGRATDLRATTQRVTRSVSAQTELAKRLEQVRIGDQNVLLRSQSEAQSLRHYNPTKDRIAPESRKEPRRTVRAVESPRDAHGNGRDGLPGAGLPLRSQSASHQTSGRSQERPVLIDPKVSPETITGTRLAEVNASLAQLQNNIDTAIKQKRAGGSKPRIPPRAAPHPIVVKWVDYTNKFGIGYVLSDGSIGCLFNSDEVIPSTSIIVRGGEKHVRDKDLPTYSERGQIVPIRGGAPVEFIEHRGDLGLLRISVDPREYYVEPGAGSIADQLGTGVDSYDRARRKSVVLWRKFGNYMSESLGASEETIVGSADVDPRPVIKFYQRLGDVGIWGFVDGAFQFNFPDHTKLVLSNDGLYCDLYHLPAHAAYRLQKFGALKDPNSLTDRGVMSLPTRVLTWLDQPEDPSHAVLDANQLELKLQYIRNVVVEWRLNGGLGCLGPDCRARLEWQGMRELPRRGQQEKLVWATVGGAGSEVRRVPLSETGGGGGGSTIRRAT
ncbi:MAG: hypothetical protein M1825_000652 [Sarcosagium campestre]|nr:MAG: hypothetical protein M1825_000652 [Sarcosagium campestre]